MDFVQEIQSFQSHIYRSAVAAKEECLKGIMKMVLGYEPVTPDDVKKFQLISHESHPGREFIGFMGIMIGEIKYYQRYEDDRAKLGYEFEPKSVID